VTDNELTPLELIENSKFMAQVLTAYGSFFSRHFEAYAADPTINLDTYGTQAEVRIKNLLLSSLDLYQYFKDLTLLSEYFHIDRRDISTTYKGKLSQEEYFSYHYENFVIRIVTSIDICAKIGNILYDLGIQDRFCNWHGFAYHKDMQGSAPASKLIDCANYLSEFKAKRHAQLHWGKPAANDYGYIVTFGDVDNESGKAHLPIEDRIDALIEDQMGQIKVVLNKLGSHIVTVLDSMQEKLDKLVAELPSGDVSSP